MLLALQDTTLLRTYTAATLQWKTSGGPLYESVGGSADGRGERDHPVVLTGGGGGLGTLGSDAPSAFYRSESSQSMLPAELDGYIAQWGKLLALPTKVLQTLTRSDILTLTIGCSRGASAQEATTHTPIFDPTTIDLSDDESDADSDMDEDMGLVRRILSSGSDGGLHTPRVSNRSGPSHSVTRALSRHVEDSNVMLEMSLSRRECAVAWSLAYDAIVQALTQWCDFSLIAETFVKFNPTHQHSAVIGGAHAQTAARPKPAREGNGLAIVRCLRRDGFVTLWVGYVLMDEISKRAMYTAIRDVVMQAQRRFVLSPSKSDGSSSKASNKSSAVNGTKTSVNATSATGSVNGRRPVAGDATPRRASQKILVRGA